MSISKEYCEFVEVVRSSHPFSDGMSFPIPEGKTREADIDAVFEFIRAFQDPHFMVYGAKGAPECKLAVRYQNGMLVVTKADKNLPIDTIITHVNFVYRGKSYDLTPVDFYLDAETCVTRSKKDPFRYRPDTASFCLDYYCPDIHPSVLDVYVEGKKIPVPWHVPEPEPEPQKAPKPRKPARIGFSFLPETATTTIVIPNFDMTVGQFEGQIKANRETISKAKHLVIDLRGNGGGNARLARCFFAMLTGLEINYTLTIEMLNPTVLDRMEKAVFRDGERHSDEHMDDSIRSYYVNNPKHDMNVCDKARNASNPPSFYLPLFESYTFMFDIQTVSASFFLMNLFRISGWKEDRVFYESNDISARTESTFNPTKYTLESGLVLLIPSGFCPVVGIDGYEYQNDPAPIVPNRSARE